MGLNRIVIGMRSGTILEVAIDETKISEARIDKKMPIRKWMLCIDHETPIGVSVDMVSQRIFTITKGGLLTVWDVLTLDIIWAKDFNKLAQKIIAFKLSKKLLVVFENDIIVLESNISNGYDEIKEFELKLNKICDAKLNTNEMLLGVASLSSLTPDVSLYETQDGFSKLSTYYGFKTAIKYIDFSTDNYYLQVEEINGEI
jgi:hypothetical protein